MMNRFASRVMAAGNNAAAWVFEDQYDVQARIADRAERDELWQEVVLAQAPFFAKYEENSGRTIPVALLTSPIPTHMESHEAK